jgi:hypothetical protein
MLARRPRLRRVIAVVTGALGVWCLALIVAGYAAGGCQQRGVERRLATAFEAKVGFADADLALVRGRFAGDDLRMAKTTPLGTMAVTVGRLEAELAPLGLALLDHRIRVLRLERAELSATTLELLKTRDRGGKPFAVDALELTDVHLVTMPLAPAPALAKIEVTIERARAGPTVFRTALSWVFALEELVARIEVADGVTVRIDYRGGKLRASGGMFGATWVDVPFAIPVLDPAHEMQQLAAIGVELASKMTLRQAETWLQRGWDAVSGAIP